MDAIVLEVQLNRGPSVMTTEFQQAGYSDELWYPTVSQNGIISWSRSTSQTPPTPANIKGPEGPRGISVASVVQIGGDHSPGTYDTYRMTFTDGTHFDYQVYNGDDGQAVTYEYDQAVASSEWTIQHNLGKYPAVTVVDTAGTEIVGDVQYVNENLVILTFQGIFSGTAYLN